MFGVLEVGNTNVVGSVGILPPDLVDGDFGRLPADAARVVRPIITRLDGRGFPIARSPFQTFHREHLICKTKLANSVLQIDKTGMDYTVSRAH